MSLDIKVAYDIALRKVHEKYSLSTGGHTKDDRIPEREPSRSDNRPLPTPPVR